MYFASTEEQRWVQRGLLPDLRRQPVAEELRGWNWDRPPLRSIYDRPLGVYEVAGKYCPTGRDVFLRRVQQLKTVPNVGMREGQRLHRVVADVLTEAKRLIYVHGQASVPFLEALASGVRSRDEDDARPTEEDDLSATKVRAVRAFESRRIVERVEAVLARQPHIQADGLAMLALPVSVEMKLDGRFLGLSEHLAADGISFPDTAVLDLKFGLREPFHRLTTTGYALVLESLFERPVDVGCVVYARFMNGRIVVERDFHLIGDELRQMFVEERDEKVRLVAEELDPGLPAVCPRSCPYLRTCRPADQGRVEPLRGPMSANLVDAAQPEAVAAH
ncbi:MAG: type I-A CRISPR-associated protein Cas4/Csa1 [Chloroflexi bacterium]|nr:type I-A CRISPR-associated protein Cas4/Csa1 [Chloroflexota bacterium]